MPYDTLALRNFIFPKLSVTSLQFVIQLNKMFQAKDTFISKEWVKYNNCLEFIEF